MTYAQPGNSTSEAEVTNVSRQGFWLLLGDEELFVAFKDFPWFAEAPIAKLTHVELPQPHHLYWPELDVDLHVDSIRNPAEFPLVADVTNRLIGKLLMKNNFENYLISQGYSQKTPNGNPSTVYDYIKRIDKVCEYEKTSWEMLAQHIATTVREYDIGGIKQELGDQSHRAVINALKRFEEFVKLKLK